MLEDSWHHQGVSTPGISWLFLECCYGFLECVLEVKRNVLAKYCENVSVLWHFDGTSSKQWTKSNCLLDIYYLIFWQKLYHVSNSSIQSYSAVESQIILCTVSFCVLWSLSQEKRSRCYGIQAFQKSVLEIPKQLYFKWWYHFGIYMFLKILFWKLIICY